MLRFPPAAMTSSKTPDFSAMSSNTTEKSAQSSVKYLTVVLGEEAYGLGVLAIREIIRHQKVTPVPQMPDYVKGVINLRGRVIPIIDLRVKFGVPAAFTERTCIVVVQVALTPDHRIQMGLIVDAVEEVVNLAAADIEPTPEFGTSVDTAYLLGMAKVKGEVKMLLDLDRVVSSDALQALGAAR
jgi:purine-binding chemotaxis protein CheW